MGCLRGLGGVRSVCQMWAGHAELEEAFARLDHSRDNGDSEGAFGWCYLKQATLGHSLAVRGLRWSDDMKLLIPLVAAALLATACTNTDDLIAFDGHFFRTKVKKVDRQLDVFTVNIRDVSQSLDGAREAGEHAGISWCVKYFGSSEIEWTVGPDTPADQLPIVDDTLVFQGVCPTR